MYVIQNGTLYTMEAEGVVRADLRIENGKITEIGAALPAHGAEVIDAAGKCVLPGFVDAHSHIGGLAGVKEQDLNEITNPLTPELDALYAIDPASDSFACAIRQGITTSCIAPGSANVVCGWAMAYKSAGKNRLLKDPVAMKAAMGINPKGCYSKKNAAPMTRMAIADLLRTWLRDVKEYMRKKEEAGG